MWILIIIHWDIDILKCRDGESLLNYFVITQQVIKSTLTYRFGIIITVQ